uniref:Putative ovule protein n=1 Tax=Solanum chacoense TaxID=4108 RepID=A0A0V0GVT5_SOLCH
MSGEGVEIMVVGKERVTRVNQINITQFQSLQIYTHRTPDQVYSCSKMQSFLPCCISSAKD